MSKHPTSNGGKGCRQDAGGTLTARQREVLVGIASGKAHKQVASALGITYQTLCTHRRELYRRLGIHSQTEAVRVAVRMGIV